MTPRLTLPSISEAPEEHADWIELNLLVNRSSFISWADHERSLVIGADGEEVSDDGVDELERLLDDTASEFASRSRACGGALESYPFVATAEGVEARAIAQMSVYQFLLLLSRLGKNAGPPSSHAERLFEELSAVALRQYLGVSSGADTWRFGFPRRVGPPGFGDAVQHLCGALGEGAGARDTPESAHQKDAHLDIVAWKGFPDRKPGQLIAFGQCATGENWESKVAELNPSAWCRLWLNEMPLVDPVGAFFVPHRVERKHWRRTTAYGGILFDRCRIAWLTPSVDGRLGEELAEWVSQVLDQYGAGSPV